MVVCGAGAAGLSAAASLRRAGLDPVILERSSRVGASWRSRYPALRLNTPGWMSTASTVTMCCSPTARGSSLTS
ncbi:MAG: FAD-dependent oxidoreductase [Solirubrobacterales bacterium]